MEDICAATYAMANARAGHSVPSHSSMGEAGGSVVASAAGAALGSSLSTAAGGGEGEGEAKRELFRDHTAQKRVSHVEFGLLSTAEIQRVSNLQVWSKKMYDSSTPGPVGAGAGAPGGGVAGGAAATASQRPTRNPAEHSVLDRRLVSPLVMRSFLSACGSVFYTAVDDSEWPQAGERFVDVERAVFECDVSPLVTGEAGGWAGRGSSQTLPGVYVMRLRASRGLLRRILAILTAQVFGSGF